MPLPYSSWTGKGGECTRIAGRRGRELQVSSEQGGKPDNWDGHNMTPLYIIKMYNCVQNEVLSSVAKEVIGKDYDEGIVKFFVEYVQPFRYRKGITYKNLPLIAQKVNMVYLNNSTMSDWS